MALMTSLTADDGSLLMILLRCSLSLYVRTRTLCPPPLPSNYSLAELDYE
jgi:hypothetical protein